MSASSKLFYAEVATGYIIKVTIDTLNQGNLQRGYFTFTQDGMTLRQPDRPVDPSMLYDIVYPQKYFKNYECAPDGEKTISMNLKHMQHQLKGVKKKDSIIMYRERDNPEKFVIIIKSGGVKESARIETNGIACREEKNYNPINLPEGGYNYPMVIGATDFQKIKRLTTIGKTINIVIQRKNYLSFKCDSGAVYDSSLEFGELAYAIAASKSSGKKVDKPKKGKKSPPPILTRKCLRCKNVLDECWCQCETCGEYKSPDGCWCQCETCGDYQPPDGCKCNATPKSSGAVTSQTTSEEAPDIFSASYYSNMLTRLIKLPGLCSQMQFYAPTIKGFPLKIEVTASQSNYTLGTIQVFIKDIDQINYEMSMANDQETVLDTTKSKKSKS
jgi:hypothetical protein